MKKLSLFPVIFLSVFSFAQVNEQFSDGNFTENPEWKGTTDNFIVNSNLQLQSCATATSKSFLFTPSVVFDNAVWECWVKINYPPSSSNYASIYLTSDREDTIDNCNAYYVMIGGTNDEVSLFLQQGEKKTKIIPGEKKRFDFDTVEVHIRVTRDPLGNFSLYSKRPDENEFFLEGEVRNNAIRSADFFGIMYSNTTKTGHCYLFDDITVTGDIAYDMEPPEWISTEIISPRQLKLVFSETMNYSNAEFEVDNLAGVPESINIATDKCSVLLTFSKDFESGILYQIQSMNLTDMAGNPLEKTTQNFAVVEQIGPGDVIINEIMFEQPETSYEYIEFYNVSDKILDASQIIFTTRKTDGSLNSGNSITQTHLFLPGTYLAVTENAEVVRYYHNCPAESNIVATKWSALNNQEATLVLTDKTKEVIFDEQSYSTKWHHTLVRNPKGVALERISPLLAGEDSGSWHSASSETNHGTPGYRNSQYRDIESPASEDKFVWLEPEAFSPDNDGHEDVCLIHYKTDEPGYIANITIFNPSGVKMCRIASGSLLSTEGFFIWDGKTDAGNNANAGIYVVYFEIFNPQTGKKKQMKLPVVVSAL